MKLGEFIKNFSHNNIIRLYYKYPGGYKAVLNSWDDVSMDHEILKGKGKNRHYINNEVLGLAGIYFPSGYSSYPEAVNIVIEDLGDKQPVVEEVLNSSQYFYDQADFILKLTRSSEDCLENIKVTKNR